MTLVKIRPHKDSWAGIGCFYEHREPYGKHIGIYFGRYLIDYSDTFGFGFCNYFATDHG